MDTKSKSKKGTVLGVIAVIIIFIGYICLCVSLLNADSIISYSRNTENDVHLSQYNKKDEVLILLHDYSFFYGNKMEVLKNNESTSYIDEELEIIEKKLNDYAGQGYRFAIKSYSDEYSDTNGRIIYKDKMSGDVTTAYIFSTKYHYSDSVSYIADIDDAGHTVEEYYDVYVWLHEDTLVKNILNYEANLRNIGRKYFDILYIGAFIIVFGMILTAIAASVRFSDGHKEIVFYNRIYNDINLFIYLFISFWILYFSVHFYGYGYRYENYPIEVFWISEIFGGLIFTFLSHITISNIVKRCRRNEFIKYTLIYSAFNFIIRSIRNIYKLLKESTRDILKAFKTNLRSYLFMFAFLSILFTVINGIIIVFLFLRYRFLYSAVYAIFSFAVVGFLILKYSAKISNELEDIKTSAEKIRNGDLESKLDTDFSPLFGSLPENLNHISEGMNKAVKKATASEKMKTELISNVSHDLKTPLTSIISYVEFLSEDESLSDESKDYVNIIKQKSLRLKNMIADIFDLSKATSLEELSVNETLGFKQLIEQTVTEMSDKIETSKSPLKLSLPKHELYIKGDGKKLYRVLQNLIDNAIKYSMPGTRIFAELYEDKGEAVFTIKNISSYEMNFTESEILERFKRGDESRSSEGSGLGLSIAESFTKNCGGDLNINIDGDVFKAEVIFNAVKGN